LTGPFKDGILCLNNLHDHPAEFTILTANNEDLGKNRLNAVAFEKEVGVSFVEPWH
jgi:hypothetical protein